MQRDDEKLPTVKVGERTLPGGIVVEYYCTVGGPTLDDCMKQVMRIAADALMRKGI